MPPTIETLRIGDTSKPDPFTICIVANPALEAPWMSGVFTIDPILGRQSAFDLSAKRIVDTLFGQIPGQRENILSDPVMAAAVRVISLFDSSLAAEDSNSLVAQDGASSQLIARRAIAQPFVLRYGYVADVLYAVSASATHRRATAWYASDDDAAPGFAFLLDGATNYHRTRCLIPGTVAVHESSDSLTPLHEFQHAISSYTNGMIVDLYAENVTAVNNKVGRPIPGSFGSYDSSTYAADKVRDSLGYPSSWKSYHCDPISSGEPAVMDDYFQTAVPISCQNDRITRQFVIDRIRAKMSR